MPLSYDPEFLAAFQPLIPKLAAFPKPARHDVATRRANLSGMGSLLYSVPPSDTIPDTPLPGVTHTQHTATHAGHSVTVHRFSPSSPPSTPAPAILHMHGGGFIAIAVPDVALGLAAYVLRSGIQLFSVAYRLSPETPYPGPLDDGWTALQWLHANAGTFNIDTARLAVFGESAGGNLAAGLAVRARDRGLTPALKKQILVYPMLDYRTVTNLAGPLAFWAEEDNITGWAAYLGRERYEALMKGRGEVEGEASPAHVKEVKGLPELYLEVPQLDIFCGEDVRYAGRLVEEGITTELHVIPGLPHGFEALGQGARAIERSMEWRVRAMKGL
ncbi:Alpha/beta hydrolase fold-containing protein 10 [Elsinoe fawcettii]|nr:Alpha/beta hydrolase fold-containing protein 10 [Elsinoe fawcettii]